MTRTEHLLTIMAEECAEVAQRVSKALRFGLEEVQPGQPLTNAERIGGEMLDLLAVYSMLHAAGAVPSLGILTGVSMPAVVAKKEKVEKFLAYSAACGLVDGETPVNNYPHPEANAN